jgi:hypothetical protein
MGAGRGHGPLAAVQGANRAATRDAANTGAPHTANGTSGRTARRISASSARGPIVIAARDMARILSFPGLAIASSSAGQPQLTGAQGSDVVRAEAQTSQPPVVHGGKVQDHLPLGGVFAGREQPLDKAPSTSWFDSGRDYARRPEGEGAHLIISIVLNRGR